MWHDADDDVAMMVFIRHTHSQGSGIQTMLSFLRLSENFSPTCLDVRTGGQKWRLEIEAT